MLICTACCVWRGKAGQAAQKLLDAGGEAVTLTAALAGSMALWGGLMEILRERGDLVRLGRVLRRILAPLFPGVHQEEAWSAMSMNMSANLLGLGNAATPAGIEAAKLLADSGCLQALSMLLALNNAGMQLMPTTVIALRAAAGSADPAGIWGACMVTSACAAVTASVFLIVGRKIRG